LCREQAAELRPHAQEFAQGGGKLVVVGNGWPAMAKSWAQHAGFPQAVEVLTDPRGRRMTWLASNGPGF